MSNIPYFLYDVFSLKPGGGGTLAVVDCRRVQGGLSTNRMQDIAKEFGFPETTFIYGPINKQNCAKVKIFTPVMELPMAGHPVIGTSIHLFNTQDTGENFVLELGVGDTQIEIENSSSRQAFMFQQPCERHEVDVDRDEIASAFSVQSDCIGDSPIEVFSAGLAFIIIQMNSKECLYALKPNRELITKACKNEPNPRIYAFSFDDQDPSQVHARMFNPDPGDGLEDPATGSAAGALTHYLKNYYPKTFEESTTLKISQGVTMGRPSEIFVSLVENFRGELVPRVGGSAVKIDEGNLEK